MVPVVADEVGDAVVSDATFTEPPKVSGIVAGRPVAGAKADAASGVPAPPLGSQRSLPAPRLTTKLQPGKGQPAGVSARSVLLEVSTLNLTSCRFERTFLQKGGECFAKDRMTFEWFWRHSVVPSVQKEIAYKLQPLNRAWQHALTAGLAPFPRKWEVVEAIRITISALRKLQRTGELAPSIRRPWNCNCSEDFVVYLRVQMRISSRNGCL